MFQKLNLMADDEWHLAIEKWYRLLKFKACHSKNVFADIMLE